MRQPAIERYGLVAQALHWPTAVLVLIAFTFGPDGSEQRVYAPQTDFERQLHETFGI
jgi:cytochrome b561